MNKIHKCPKCNKYSMREKCPFDDALTLRAVPLKYSENKTIARIRKKLKDDKTTK